ncbi:MAG: PKD domain-containing protein [Gammaproteobacteria bacterium]|nr:PKD domain-containing protein [Gammaproteobacteria bacterium]MDH4254921.1 PKD domain-containing protein [Gammaproteobacteria bacterium]MDH5309894.1 PKD domain-containing protein [Gammaproteobacteria bacterium]
MPLLLGACLDQSGDTSGEPAANRPPVVNAGSDMVVVESSSVQLSGSATDPDGDALSYAWSQVGGPTVAIQNASQALAGFSAPDVAPGVSIELQFRLSVADGSGGIGSDDIVVTVQEPGALVNLSGTVQYEFPPPNELCRGLDFNAIERRPVRGATLQVLDAGSNALLATTTTDANGSYSVVLDADTNVFVRVVSELKRSGTPSWDVEVRNNVVDPADPNPPALANRPRYFLDGTSFNTGGINLRRDLVAASGWTGAGYGEPRAAAPFAVLDTIYQMMQLVLAANPSTAFPPLDAFWSPENGTSRGTGSRLDDIDSGDLGTSFYASGLDALFLLGREGDDAEEFDDHVIGHEWGHYFEDKFSRSDSVGGAHGIGDRLDKRVAFGEGFATALAGIGLANPLYCDTFWGGNGQLTGFDIDLESERTTSTNRGWYNEVSILKLVYDLWDSNVDGSDTDSVGFGLIYDVMTGPQRSTTAFTSAFSFFEAVKSAAGTQAGFVDGLLAAESIGAEGINPWGEGETNDAGAAADVLPLYTDISPGQTVRLCSNSQFDGGRNGNKLSEVRYLRMELGSPTALAITVDTVDPPSVPSDGFDCRNAAANDPEIHRHSDPDLMVWRSGQLMIQGASCQPNREAMSRRTLQAGTYVMDLTEFRYADDQTPGDYPERTCFDVTVSQ